MVVIVPFIFSIINVALRGVIIYFFWRWFVTTQFYDVSDLFLIGCIGLSVFINVLTPWQRLSEEEIKESTEVTAHRDLNNFFYYLIGLLLSFGLGWIITLFM